MKKFFLSISVIGAFAVYSFIRYGIGSAQQTPSPVAGDIPSPEPSATPPQNNPTAVSSTVSPLVPKKALPKGQYADGSYTGDTFDAFYGNIQVQAVISGGKLTDVKFLQYPNDRSTSIEINSQAMPMLKQEAIQVQSANVNVISGASDTSSAFIQSLGTALGKAKI